MVPGPFGVLLCPCLEHTGCIAGGYLVPYELVGFEVPSTSMHANELSYGRVLGMMAKCANN